MIVKFTDKFGEQYYDGETLPEILRYVLWRRCSSSVYWYEDCREEAFQACKTLEDSERFMKKRQNYEYEGWEIIFPQKIEV